MGALSPGVAWLLIEGPAERGTLGPLASLDSAVVLREPDLRTLGTLLARAGLYVGNDSGITHLAAAWGAPTLALFGPTDPAVWAPVGERSQALRAPGGDLAALRVADVVRQARAMWSAPGPPCG